MREIKFRAWDKNNKGFINGFNMYGFSTGQGAPRRKLKRFSSEWNEEDVELMQFTGFKDKMGKGIYEGDILLTRYAGLEDAYYKVIFKDGSFMALEKGCKYPDLLIDIVKDSVVIGNKYENLEFLEV